MPKLGKPKRKSRYKNDMSIDITNYLYALNKVDIAGFSGITEISQKMKINILQEV